MNHRNLPKPYFLLIGILTLCLGLLLFSIRTGTASAEPTSVTIAGTLQDELGCPYDWQADCAATQLSYNASDDVWQGIFNIPSGNWEYKAAIDESWDENYGANAQPNGANIPLNLTSATSVKFYYDHKSHWITSNQNSVIAIVAGSFQSEIGCPGDWDAGCLRSWLQDPDGDGYYTFTTNAIPPGNYEAKVAIGESWDENYGQGGEPGGAPISFSIPAANSKATFIYNIFSNILEITITPAHAQDNNVEWDGLRHDSRDTLYRTPGGAVPAGTPVTLRLRTFHNDVSLVSMRVYDLNATAQYFLDMSLAASNVSCYQADLAGDSCDFWEATLPNYSPDNLWYRFIVTDGTDTDYYADNTPALDGGLGSPSDDLVDNSFALTVYDPSFIAPDWAPNAVIYQIFPDRFRNGRKDNDPITGDIRYDDPVLALPWNTLPEGYCRNYADSSTNCPWRFDETPPDSSPSIEEPRGRDYMGGDLKGVDQYLDYLQSMGVNTIYFNPIFDAGSNHGYDTQDYYKIDPYFGTQKDWENLVKHAKKRNMRIILDGVFNHLSSDSPFFDRYHHYAEMGACESSDSPYRDWFYFHDVTPGTGVCVDSDGTPDAANYDGWFGFDSIPVINKSLPAVQEYFLTGDDSVSRYWLEQGASGWRMDVMGDASFPDGYWETFRGVVKDTQSDGIIISETWQKDSTLLRMLRGDRADTTMNYRLRDAVLGFLAPGNFDSKGFADSGHVITPSEFAARIASIREDYPEAAFYSLMNILDSHDTERILWTLTPGTETTADKESNTDNLAQGKQRQMIASLIQFTMPGAPTVYYGDEVAMTGDDDPDDRRTYPWTDLGGNPDPTMFSHYQTLALLRQENQALTDGNLVMLLADDEAGTVAYGRKTTQQAVIVVINRSSQATSATIPVSGYIPDGVTFGSLYGVGNPGSVEVTVVDGTVSVTLDPNSAWLLATGSVDLQPPAAPTLSLTNVSSEQVSLSWNAVSGATAYNLYRSPLSGGGWVKINDSPLDSTDYMDSDVINGKNYYYVVTALDIVGNESVFSNEINAIPHYLIGWANLQWPPTLEHTISTINRTDNVYGQVWIDGITSQPGPTPGLIAQLGFGPAGSNPNGNPDWTWEPASFNVDAGDNDEFMASLLPETISTFDYLYRYSTTNGIYWLYADLNGPIPDGNPPPNPGDLTVVSSGDLTPPAKPTGLMVSNASPVSISLAWDSHPDADVAGFEIYRDGERLATVLDGSATSFTDTAVTENSSYSYYLIAIDTSFNRSDPSNEVTATAAPRTVTVTFNVTVPATTDATGLSVYIAGTLQNLDGNLPEWDPAGVVLTRVDSTHWTITLTGKESTSIEYKYTLGDWAYVEKDGSCEEIANRQLTVSYGTNGFMVINDTVPNWRNVAPCGAN